MVKRDVLIFIILLLVTVVTVTTVQANSFELINLTEEIVIPVNTAELDGSYQTNVNDYIPDDLMNNVSDCDYEITKAEMTLTLFLVIVLFILSIIFLWLAFDEEHEENEENEENEEKEEKEVFQNGEK